MAGGQVERGAKLIWVSKSRGEIGLVRLSLLVLMTIASLSRVQEIK